MTCFSRTNPLCIHFFYAHSTSSKVLFHEEFESVASQHRRYTHIAQTEQLTKPSGTPLKFDVPVYNTCLVTLVTSGSDILTSQVGKKRVADWSKRARKTVRYL
jgi:hypothetical protein